MSSRPNGISSPRACYNVDGTLQRCLYRRYLHIFVLGLSRMDKEFVSFTKQCFTIWRRNIETCKFVILFTYDLVVWSIAIMLSWHEHVLKKTETLRMKFWRENWWKMDGLNLNRLRLLFRSNVINDLLSFYKPRSWCTRRCCLRKGTCL